MKCALFQVQLLAGHTLITRLGYQNEQECRTGVAFRGLITALGKRRIAARAFGFLYYPRERSEVHRIHRLQIAGLILHCIRFLLIIEPKPMADISPTTSSTTSRHQGPGSESTDKTSKAKEGSQEPDIKRQVKTKKINLTTFCTLDDATKWKKLNSLIRVEQGPLRLCKEEVDGKRILYLRPRTWGQYFYETLFLFPAEQEARCDKVRAAIQIYIRPYLDAQETTTTLTQNPGETQTATLLNTERTAILDRLDCRVYTDRIDPVSFYGNKPSHVPDKKKKGNIFSQEMRRAYHGMTTVPKGLSIARIAPFKVTADVRILTKATHILADQLPIPGENCSPPKEWICKKRKQSGNKSSRQKYYEAMLDAYAKNKRTIVLEVGNDSNEHWHAAYDAAHRWLGKQPATEKPSIMLVPLYRADDFLPSMHNRSHNQAWPVLMANKLKMEDVRVTNQATYLAASPVTSNASVDSKGWLQERRLHNISGTPNDNDDNDNDNY